MTATTDLIITTRSPSIHTHIDRLQGLWTEEQYLKLTDASSAQIEFVDGRIEELAIPTDLHQQISLWLISILRGYIVPRGGVVRYSPLRMRVQSSAFREPDILLLLDKDDGRRQNRFWLGADLVVEIISRYTVHDALFCSFSRSGWRLRQRR
jgi:Uma2 family endonuclease